MPAAWGPSPGRGRWTFRLERDGRDGLAGGDDPAGWDVVATESSPGAKPATVSVGPTNSAWAITVFSPGGEPCDTSEIVLGLGAPQRGHDQRD
jgi:hypothetical protein